MYDYNGRAKGKWFLKVNTIIDSFGVKEIQQNVIFFSEEFFQQNCIDFV